MKFDPDNIVQEWPMRDKRESERGQVIGINYTVLRYTKTVIRS